MISLSLELINNIQLCTFWKCLSINLLTEVFLMLSKAKTRLGNEMGTVTYKTQR